MLLQPSKQTEVSKLWRIQRVTTLWLEMSPRVPRVAVWSAHSARSHFTVNENITIPGGRDPPSATDFATVLAVTVVVQVALKTEDTASPVPRDSATSISVVAFFFCDLTKPSFRSSFCDYRHFCCAGRGTSYEPDSSTSITVEALCSGISTRRASAAAADPETAAASAQSSTTSWRSQPWSCSCTQPGRQQLHPCRHGNTTLHESLFTSCSGSPPTLNYRMGTHTIEKLEFSPWACGHSSGQVVAVSRHLVFRVAARNVHLFRGYACVRAGVCVFLLWK